MEPSEAPTNTNTNNDANIHNRARLVVPKRMCQGGFDEKFEEDTYNLDLKGVISPAEYSLAVRRINERIKPARSKAIDGALLATGVLMVPLGLWGARRYSQAKRRKKLLLEAIREFNEAYPSLYMRWNRRPVSCLTIEHRVEGVHGPPPPSSVVNETSGLQGSKDVYFEYD